MTTPTTMQGQLQVSVPGFKLTDFIDLSMPNHGLELKSIKQTIFGEGLEEFPDTTQDGQTIFNAYSSQNDTGRMDYVSGTFTYGDTFDVNDNPTTITRKEALSSLIDFAKLNLFAVAITYGWEQNPKVIDFLSGFDKMKASEDKMELTAGTFLAGTVIEENSVFLIGAMTWGNVKDPENNETIPYIVFNMGVLAGEYAENVIDYLNKSMTPNKPH